MRGWPADAPELALVRGLLEEAADAVRSLVRAAFRGPLSVRYKPDRTPVTDVDRRIEAALRKAIRASFPAHAIAGEELEDEGGTASPFTWVIDPIDGTKSFMTGKPLFGTLVALSRETVPVLGLMEVPMLGERWFAAAGSRAELNGRRCRASSTRALAEATLHSTTIDMFEEDARASFERLSSAVRFRAFGGDCYNYGLLASGFVDLVVEADLKAYDYAALVPIVTGAGGVITDWAGNPLGAPSGASRVVAAANARLHAAALERLRGE